VPVIIITAFGDIESAVDAMKGGAYHYLAKPFRMDELLTVIQTALRERGLLRDLKALRETLAEGRSDLIFESAAMRRVLDVVVRASSADTPVLLEGESGTGKELLARLLHNKGPRAAKPFLAINCAAIPEPLLESQLFGHRRGSFTDAREDRAGLFQEANGGTILLDEIGDMPIVLQGKLLRVLQEREVHPLGAPAPVPVNVRVVAATHRDLGELVEENRFREDLLYRLNVITVKIPPLRERPEDVLPLAAYLLEKHSRRLDRPDCTISPRALDLMRQYPWPGNVRELENAIERALVLGKDAIIDLEDLPDAVLGSLRGRGPERGGDRRSMADVEREHILKTLQRVGGNKAAAARILGLDRKTLYRKLEAYRLGIDDSAPDSPRRPQM
jgi:DNA-binding NtrC family response regulator